MKKGLFRFLALVFFWAGLVSPVFGATTIDVMIVFDTTAKSWASNHGGTSAFAADVVARMNQAVTNSNVALTFRLVHTAEASFTHGSSLSADLSNLQAGTGGLSSVHQWRNTYAADVVAMLVDTGSAYGTVGMGYLLDSYAGDPSYAFSVNAIQAVDIGHTLTHEVGHNLGCNHSKTQKDSPGPNTDLNTYSAGWYFTGTNSVKYHTIMAYNSDGYGTTYTSAPLFSTPLTTYEGTTAGDAQDGDNARNIRGTMDVVAAYRTAATCAYTLSATSAGFSPAAGTGSVTVTASAGTCAWTAASNNAWITITSGAAGTGSGTVGYAVAANSGVARTGTMLIGGQTFTVTQTGTAVTNSVGTRNTIKVTDMSGSLAAGGAAITVKAWDADGKALPESGSASPLKLSSHGTTTISGSDLIARFLPGAPMAYEIIPESPQVIITNVKTSTDGTLNIPIGYTAGVTNFVTNSVGSRNTIKVTDMSGALAAGGAAITVKAWDADGNALPESGSATPLKLDSHGTTTISGPDLIARFPSGAPMAYEFTVDSSQWIMTNIKGSADGSINVPSSYTTGTTHFVANAIGSRNTIKVTDMSGALAAGGADITVKAWDTAGNALAEAGSATPLKLYSHGTTPISGTDLIARFPTGAPMAYEFTVGSSKYIITNVKSSTDGTVNVPSVYTSGMTNYAANDISSRSTIKVTDLSGSLAAEGLTMTVTAWDTNGNALAEAGGAAPLKLYSYGTTPISGPDLIARFPAGDPVSYEFTIGSSRYVVTNLTTNADGSLNIPAIGYAGGVGGGI